MREFSFGDAVGAGFKLIGRNPLAVLMWGVTGFVLTQLVSLILLAVTGGNMFTVMQHAATGAQGATPDFASLMRMEQPFLLAFPFQLILMLIYYAVVTNAVFRALLDPSDKRFFYMRFGKRELRQAAVIICQFFGAMLVILGLIAAGVAATVAIGGSGASANLGVKFLVGFVCWIAAFACYIWLWLRFSLAPAMTFAQNSFRLFESWPMTRGQAWKLFGVGVVLFVIMVAIGFAVEVIVATVMFSVIGINGFTPQAMAAGGPFQNMQAMLPLTIGIGVIMSLLGGGIHAIVMAPWAEAYRQLSGHNDLASTVSTFE